jgi:predicted MFS family arabinose efflux permease
MAANMLFMMVGSRLAVKLLAKQRNEEWAIMINQAAMGVLLVCTVVIGNLWGLVPFLAHQVFRGFWNPLKEAYLHDHIESRDRATIVSFESVMYHMAGAAGLVVSGFLGKQYGILTTWILVGSFLSIGTIGVYWLRKK